MVAALSLDEARKLVEGCLRPRPIVDRPLSESVGLRAARELRSDRDFPPFDRIAMDGYAVRAADVVGASEETPVRLQVLGSARAGEPFDGEIGPRQCTKAMTGAPMPMGADAIVPIEKTAGYSDDFAVILAPVAEGAHYARRGEDLASGGALLPAGTRLREEHLQALASAGHATLPVHAPPHAAVLATGDELIPPEQAPGEGQIRESNGSAIEGILRAWGVEVGARSTCPDRLDELTRYCGEALQAHDLLVLSGGVSKGEHDHVKDALRALGVRLHFESLRLRPGHPTTFGTLGDKAVFALPGNPVAVVATLSVVFGPGMRRWLGAREAAARHFAALEFAHLRKGDREQLLPVRLRDDAETGRRQVLRVEHHGSGDFVSLARADAFAYFSAQQSRFEAGEVVEIFPFRSLF